MKIRALAIVAITVLVVPIYITINSLNKDSRYSGSQVLETTQLRKNIASLSVDTEIENLKIKAMRTVGLMSSGLTKEAQRSLESYLGVAVISKKSFKWTLEKNNKNNQVTLGIKTNANQNSASEPSTQNSEWNGPWLKLAEKLKSENFVVDMEKNAEGEKRTFVLFNASINQKNNNANNNVNIGNVNIAQKSSEISVDQKSNTENVQIMVLLEAPFFQKYIESIKSDMGFSYIMSDKGTALAHPITEYIGTSLANEGILQNIRNTNANSGSVYGESVKGEKTISLYTQIPKTNLILISQSKFLAAIDWISIGRIWALAIVSILVGFGVLQYWLKFALKLNLNTETQYKEQNELNKQSAKKTNSVESNENIFATNSSGDSRESIENRESSEFRDSEEYRSFRVSGDSNVSGVSRDSREEVQTHTQNNDTAIGNFVEQKASLPILPGWAKAGQTVSQLADKESQTSSFLTHEKNELKEKNPESMAIMYRLVTQIKSPIIAILGHVQMAKNQNVPTNILKSIETDARLAREYLDRVSDYSSPITAANLVAFSIVDVLENALRTCESQILKNGIKVNKNINSDKIKKNHNSLNIKGDPDSMKLALTAILKNAIESMERVLVKNLNINLRVDGSTIFLNIEDTGVGILAENLNKIIEPFFSTKSPLDHKGLGLSSAYGIIKKSGGKIQVDSDPGRGTQVEVVLTASKEKPLSQNQINESGRDKAIKKKAQRSTDIDPFSDLSLRELTLHAISPLESANNEDPKEKTEEVINQNVTADARIEINVEEFDWEAFSISKRSALSVDSSEFEKNENQNNEQHINDDKIAGRNFAEPVVENNLKAPQGKLKKRSSDLDRMKINLPRPEERH